MLPPADDDRGGGVPARQRRRPAFAEAAEVGIAELAGGDRRPRRLPRPDDLPLGRRRRAGQGHLADRPAGVDRRDHRRAGRRRPARPRHRRRRPRSTARQPVRSPAARRVRPTRRPRSTSAGSPTSRSSSPSGTTLAFDTGPASALIDAAVEHVSGGAERYDRDGARARRGRGRRRAARPAARTSRTTAGRRRSRRARSCSTCPTCVERVGDRAIDRDDLVATVTALTARTVADACREHGVRRLVVSGGGVANPALMEMLAQRAAGDVGSRRSTSSASRPTPRRPTSSP